MIHFVCFRVKSFIEITRRIVCNYCPQGNVIGQGVYKVGPACSECPSNVCSDKWPGLCKVFDKPSDDQEKVTTESYNRITSTDSAKDDDHDEIEDSDGKGKNN